MMYFFVLCFMFGWTLLNCTVEKLIIIIVPSYNNIKFYKKNLDSIRKQTYSNYRVLYIDDCSTDGTAQAVEEYIQLWDLKDKICLIKNTNRHGALYNHFMATHCCPNDAIILTLDGDDWLPDKSTVLTYINMVYQDPNIWMTYGQFEEYPSGKKGLCKKLPDGIKHLHAYRDYNWVTSHLRTYYAGLFKAIPVGYFIKKGSFLGSASDLAIMFALLELSGGRALFIDDILYTYNTTNVNSDCRTRVLEQLNNDYWVRSRVPLPAFADCSWAYDQKLYDVGVYNLHISLKNSPVCNDYLVTTSYTDIKQDHTQVWYRMTTQAEDAAYQVLGEQHEIVTRTIDHNTDFRKQMLTYLKTLPEDAYLLITGDGYVWDNYWSGGECVDMLIKTKALSYNCTWGINVQDPILVSTDDVPTCVPITDSFCVWKYSEASGHWHAPYYSDGLMIKVSTLQLMIERIKGATPEQLFYNLSLLAAYNSDEVGLCNFIAPCIRVVPVE